MDRVLLSKDHTHAGVPHSPGETITVESWVAEYLVQHQVGVLVRGETLESKTQTTKVSKVKEI